MTGRARPRAGLPRHLQHPHQRLHQPFQHHRESRWRYRQGTPVNLQHDLGLDDNNPVANIGLTWRPREHHEFGLNYYNKDADKTQVLDRDFYFEDTHYQTRSTVRASVDVDSYEAYYIWWAAAHDTWSLGPRMGLVWYRIDLGLTAKLDANGAPVSGIGDSAAADLPTPTIGGSWRWDFAPKWRLNADAGYFPLNMSDIDGDVYHARLGVEWFPWQHSGFLLDYTMDRVKVDVQESQLKGTLDFNDEGVRVGYIHRF